MLQELKKISLKKAVLNFVICIVVAAALAAAMWFMGLKYLAKGIGNLNTLKDDEVEEMFVEADIQYLIDYYSYATEDGNTVEKDYFLPVGEYSYVGVAASGKNMDICDNLMQQTQECIDGTKDQVDGSLHVYGTLVKMPSDVLDYYKEYYEAIGGDEETFLPYYLKIGELGEASYWIYGVLTVNVVILVVGGIVVLWKGCTGAYEKMITDYCKQSVDYDRTLAKIESFYRMTIPVRGIRFSLDYFMAAQGKKTIFLESREILWAYQKRTEHRTNGIKTGETYELMLRLRGGRTFAFGIKGEQAVNEVLDRMNQVLPFVILGYTEEIEQIYLHNRQEMIAESDRRLERIAGNNEIL